MTRVPPDGDALDSDVQFAPLPEDETRRIAKKAPGNQAEDRHRSGVIVLSDIGMTGDRLRALRDEAEPESPLP